MHFGPEDRARCALREDDLLVCEGGEVGRAAVWPGEPADVYFQKAIHRVRPVAAGNTRFLMYCLRAAAHLKVFAIEGNQSTIVHLTGEKLREHRFPFPPLDEQAHIVIALDAQRDGLCGMMKRVRRQVSLLKEHRQALITAAVTGELGIPGAAA
jgi:type I restriction enzyme S subunit